MKILKLIGIFFLLARALKCDIILTVEDIRILYIRVRKYWRIIRTNYDGSVKIIYSDEVLGMTDYNKSGNSSKWGYR